MWFVIFQKYIHSCVDCGTAMIDSYIVHQESVKQKNSQRGYHRELILEDFNRNKGFRITVYIDRALKNV